MRVHVALALLNQRYNMPVCKTRTKQAGSKYNDRVSALSTKYIHTQHVCQFVVSFLYNICR